MASIQIDEEIAARLAAIAAEHGMTVEEYLRLVVERENGSPRAKIYPRDFDAELDELVFDGPSLPRDFSRADIYADHD
ncbi:MAG: hypothetical protein AB7O59_02305 [Pirellulales bacterium]